MKGKVIPRVFQVKETRKEKRNFLDKKRRTTGGNFWTIFNGIKDTVSYETVGYLWYNWVHPVIFCSFQINTSDLGIRINIATSFLDKLYQ